jgi:sigma-B regulation protein RsbU (phosphoserine phosphatase)
VAGKGVSAALIMGMIHTQLHSNAQFMPSPTPAAILSRANEHL